MKLKKVVAAITAISMLTAIPNIASASWLNIEDTTRYTLDEDTNQLTTDVEGVAEEETYYNNYLYTNNENRANIKYTVLGTSSDVDLTSDDAGFTSGYNWEKDKYLWIGISIDNMSKATYTDEDEEETKPRALESFGAGVLYDEAYLTVPEEMLSDDYLYSSLVVLNSSDFTATNYTYDAVTTENYGVLSDFVDNAYYTDLLAPGGPGLPTGGVHPTEIYIDTDNGTNDVPITDIEGGEELYDDELQPYYQTKKLKVLMNTLYNAEENSAILTDDGDDSHLVMTFCLQMTAESDDDKTVVQGFLNGNSSVNFLDGTGLQYSEYTNVTAETSYMPTFFNVRNAELDPDFEVSDPSSDGYTITYDKNDSSASWADNAPTTEKVADGDNATLKDADGNKAISDYITPATGMKFEGWYTKDGTGDEWGDEFTTDSTVTSDVTVYAKYVAGDYTVTYKLNNENAKWTDSTTTDKTETVKGNANPTLADTNGSFESQISYSGYKLEGWYTKDGTGDDWGDKFTADSTVTGDVTVYAKYVAGDYTVTYNLNNDNAKWTDNTTTDKTESVKGNANPTLADTDSNTFASQISYSGYKFEGWYTKDGTGDEWGDEFTTASTVTANVTVYAKYSWGNYTVTYDLNNEGAKWTDGTTTQTQTYTLVQPADGSAASNGYATYTALVLAPAGYDFVKWTIGDTTDVFTADTPVTSSITVKANYTTADTYVLTFKAGDGAFDSSTGDTKSRDVTVNKGKSFAGTYGTDATPPTPTRAHYKLAGWFDADDNEFDATKDYTNETNKTFTAKYEADPDSPVTVTFEDTKTSKEDDVKYDVIVDNSIKGSYDKDSDKFTHDDVPTPTSAPDGYTFYGWSTVKVDWTGKTSDTIEAALTLVNADVFDKDTTVSGDTTVYAVYILSSVTVTFTDTKISPEAETFDTYTLMVDKSIKGSYDTDSSKYTHDDVPTVTDAPAGYEFYGWYTVSKDAAEDTNSYTAMSAASPIKWEAKTKDDIAAELTSAGATAFDKDTAVSANTTVYAVYVLSDDSKLKDAQFFETEVDGTPIPYTDADYTYPVPTPEATFTPDTVSYNMVVANDIEKAASKIELDNTSSKVTVQYETVSDKLAAPTSAPADGSTDASATPTPIPTVQTTDKGNGVYEFVVDLDVTENKTPNTVVVTVTAPDGKATTTYTFNIIRLAVPGIVKEYGNSPAGLIKRDKWSGWTDEDRAQALKLFTGAATLKNKKYDSNYIPVIGLDSDGNKIYAQNEKPYTTQAWTSYKAKNYDLDEYAYFVYQAQVFSDPGVYFLNEYGEKDNSVTIKFEVTMQRRAGIPTYTGNKATSSLYVKKLNQDSSEIQGSKSGEWDFGSKMIRPDVYEMSYHYDYTKLGETASTSYDDTRKLIVISKLGDVSLSEQNVVQQPDSDVLTSKYTKLTSINSLLAFRIGNVSQGTNPETMNATDSTLLRAKTDYFDNLDFKYYPDI